MSLLRQQSRQEITVPYSSAVTFAAFEKAAKHLGRVKQSRPAMGVLVATVSPPGISNAATVRLALEATNAAQTRVRLESDAMDGLVGFGSAGRAMDALIGAADDVLNGRKLTGGNLGFIPLLVITAALVAAMLGFVAWALG